MNFHYSINSKLRKSTIKDSKNKLIKRQLIDNKLIDNKLIDNKLIDSDFIDDNLIDNYLNDKINTLAINNNCRNDYSIYEKKYCFKNKPIMDANFKNSVNNNLFNNVSQSERISNRLKVRKKRTIIYKKSVNKQFGNLNGKGGIILTNF